VKIGNLLAPEMIAMELKTNKELRQMKKKMKKRMMPEARCSACRPAQLRRAAPKPTQAPQA
jgi:hypothetical protein